MRARLALAGFVVALAMCAPAFVAAAPASSLKPVSDAYVNGARATRNYGTAPVLKARAGVLGAYLRFKVRPWVGQPADGLDLRLAGVVGDATTLALSEVSGGWLETSLTFLTRPAPVSDIIVRGTVASDGVHFPLGAFFDSGTIDRNYISLRVTNDVSTKVSFSSREGTAPPLVTLGTGGVSLFAAQFGLMTGARVIATTGSEEKVARLRALGVTDVIDYRATPDWDRRVRELTDGVGADLVIEVGGPGSLARSIAAIRYCGHISAVGNLAGKSTIVPNCVDAGAFVPRPASTFRRGGPVLFMGTTRYPPNFFAIQEICRDVAPALPDLEARARTNPRDVPTLLALADAYVNAGRATEAVATYQAVLAIDRDSVPALNGIGFVLFGSGEIAGARVAADRVLTLRPRDPDALFLKGLVQYRSEEWRGAVDTWAIYLDVGEFHPAAPMVRPLYEEARRKAGL